MKKPTIIFADFERMDMRVGEVKDASLVKGSKNLIKFHVDLGEDYGVVEILSGIAKWYTPEDFVGKKYVVLANIEPKQMMGMSSNGMLLAADSDEKPIFLVVDSNLNVNGLLKCPIFGHLNCPSFLTNKTRLIRK